MYPTAFENVKKGIKGDKTNKQKNPIFIKTI